MFFGKINKIDKPLDWSGKRQKTHITNIKNDRGDITIVPTDSKNDNKEILWTRIMSINSTTDEMDKFLKDMNYQNSLKKKHNTNVPLLTKDTESVIKSLPAKKTSGPHGITREFSQDLRKKEY